MDVFRPGTVIGMILLIDNYDSFVHNLARYLRRLGCATCVVRNDAVPLADVESLAPDAIVLSPGPCTPAEAGICGEVVRGFGHRIPLLGVCLGHQAIVASLGGVVAPTHPKHGEASRVWHDGLGEFRGMPCPFLAGRYHSLAAQPDSLPPALVRSAWTEDGQIMGVRHREYPMFGWQFHPESILTPLGYELLAAFLREAGIAAGSVPPSESPPPNRSWRAIDADSAVAWPPHMSF